MNDSLHFDVIIVGGSYSGLAAGMALGRALRQILIIDNNEPCNRQTPYSHNFITQDGKTPKEIATLAKQQLAQYKTVKFFQGLAVGGIKTTNGFDIQTASGETFHANKLIFATGVKDLMPDMAGFAACWGISVLHCPYCHGYEVRNEPTGLVGNGDDGFEFAALVSNWTQDLTLFTNGKSLLTPEQTGTLKRHGIRIIETEIEKPEHINGALQNIILKDGTIYIIKALYFRIPFELTCTIPKNLGCELTEEGYIKTDAVQKTTMDGIYACGDATTPVRTIANAVATGTTAGMMSNKEIVLQEF